MRSSLSCYIEPCNFGSCGSTEPWTNVLNLHQYQESNGTDIATINLPLKRNPNIGVNKGL